MKHSVSLTLFSLFFLSSFSASIITHSLSCQRHRTLIDLVGVVAPSSISSTLSGLSHPSDQIWFCLRSHRWCFTVASSMGEKGVDLGLLRLLGETLCAYSLKVCGSCLTERCASRLASSPPSKTLNFRNFQLIL